MAAGSADNGSGVSLKDNAVEIGAANDLMDNADLYLGVVFLGMGLREHGERHRLGADRLCDLSRTVMNEMGVRHDNKKCNAERV